MEKKISNAFIDEIYTQTSETEALSPCTFLIH